LLACSNLGPAARELKVLLVGPYFGESMKYAEELGMGDRAIFAGPVSYEDVPEYINACDVLCAPYDPSLSTLRSERGIGAPLKVLEYMACKKPVVSTSVGPITDVVEDGRTGLLVPPGDVSALTKALQELIGNPLRAESIGSEARKEVVAKYSWSSLAETFEHVLNDARAGVGAEGEAWN
jgi:glycosyltransferase involved in cell wall biosynthesis